MFIQVLARTILFKSVHSENEITDEEVAMVRTNQKEEIQGCQILTVELVKEISLSPSNLERPFVQGRLTS